MGFFRNRQEEYETEERMMQVYANQQVQNNKEENHRKITDSLERNRGTYTEVAGGFFSGKLSSKLTENDYREISYALAERKRFDRFFAIVTTVLIIVLLVLIIL